MLKRVPLLLFLLLPLLASRPGPTFAADTAQKVRRNVEIEWEGVDGSVLYEVKIVHKGDSRKKPQTFRLKESKWSATISPGLYQMQVRSYDDRGVPGDWSPASELEVKLPAIIVRSPGADAKLDTRDENSEKVDLSWEPVPGAEKYKVTAKSTTSDWNDERTVDANSARLEFPVGQSIEWNVVAIDAKGTEGESSPQNYRFETRGPAIAKPKIVKPVSQLLREISWKGPDKAATYSYELLRYDRPTKKWRSVEKKAGLTEPKTELDISRPSGRYRIAVQAHADRRKDSPRVQYDFDFRGGFRDPASFEHAQLRDSVTKPTNFYAIASYLVTQMTYASVNLDENTIGSFKALGGTGRLGGGYQNPDSAWGGFGIIDLSGFVIKGQNFTFSSVEAHLTRKLELGQAGILQLASGLFAKELPIVLGTPVGGYESTGKVRNIGPHGGLIYWFPLTDRLGLQANARAYYTLTGTTSTGKKASPALSYQYGLLGSYRLSKSWMGYAGYAFRRDEAKYAASSESLGSSAQPGQFNTIQIEGHYLNLLLELSF